MIIIGEIQKYCHNWLEVWKQFDVRINFVQQHFYAPEGGHTAVTPSTGPFCPFEHSLCILWVLLSQRIFKNSFANILITNAHHIEATRCKQTISLSICLFCHITWCSCTIHVHSVILPCFIGFWHNLTQMFITE